MKIMVFLHGTAIMHVGGLDKSRAERVRQVITGEASVRDFASYVPVGDAVRKLCAWEAQGAEIVYLSSHRNAPDVEKDRSVLRRWGFPDRPIYYCQGSESYGDIAARAQPDVLIEDDCESIGGEPEMTHPHIPADARGNIRSIVVKEFGGLDHLPDDIHELLKTE